MHTRLLQTSRMRRRHLIRILIWPGVAHIKKIATINIYEADEKDGASGPVCHVNMSECACTSWRFLSAVHVFALALYTGRGKTAAHHRCMLRGCRNNVSRGR